MYKKREAIVKAGNTRPTSGTKIEGKKLAVILIIKLLIYLLYQIISKICTKETNSI